MFHYAHAANASVYLCVLIRVAVPRMRGQEKWIEARTIQDCGRLEEGQVIAVLARGLGLATCPYA